MKWHDELQRQFDLRGIRVVKVEHRRKSIAYTLKRDGTVVKYYTACTPSDVRAMRNVVCDVDRMLRERKTK